MEHISVPVIVYGIVYIIVGLMFFRISYGHHVYYTRPTEKDPVTIYWKKILTYSIWPLVALSRGVTFY
jgi:hypothetical protein